MFGARVGVDRSDVGGGVGSLDHQLLHVAADDPHRLLSQALVDQENEALHVLEQFLRDALARGVDAELYVGAGEEHGSGKHADRDGFSETSGGGYEDLLAQRVPSVEVQDFLMGPGKRPGWVHFKENPCAGSDVVVVEDTLVVGSIPSQRVEDVECCTTVSHP